MFDSIESPYCVADTEKMFECEGRVRVVFELAHGPMSSEASWLDAAFGVWAGLCLRPCRLKVHRLFSATSQRAVLFMYVRCSRGLRRCCEQVDLFLWIWQMELLLVGVSPLHAASALLAIASTHVQILCLVESTFC